MLDGGLLHQTLCLWCPVHEAFAWAQPTPVVGCLFSNAATSACAFFGQARLVHTLARPTASRGDGLKEPRVGCSTVAPQGAYLRRRASEGSTFLEARARVEGGSLGPLEPGDAGADRLIELSKLEHVA